MTENGNAKKLSVEDEEEEIDEKTHPDYACGLFGINSTCCHVFRSPKWALALLCLSSVMQGLIVNGLLNVVISTIEKRFHLSSKESGMIRATNSVAQMICTLPVSYFGGKGCKPKYLGIGVICIGIGAFIFSMPHFVSEVYQASHSDNSLSGLCTENIGTSNGHGTRAVVNKQESKLEEEKFVLNSFKYFFFIGQIFHGAGSSPLWTLGVTYLDENLPTKTSSLYVSIYYAFAVLGPALGYIGGGRLLEIYTDFYSVDVSALHGLDSKHPNWVGLWWIGFLIASFFSLTVGSILTMFPKKLTGWARVQKLRKDESVVTKGVKDKKPDSDKDVGSLFTQIIKDIRRCVSNFPFLCITFNQCSEGFLLSVFSAFMPKFLESQFGAKPSDAAAFIGIIVVFCGATGMVFGGWVIKRFNMSCKTILVGVMVATFLQFPQMFAFFIKCEKQPFSGISHPEDQKFHLSPQLTQPCNAGCDSGCEGSRFDPVCGSNMVAYFSPCHAGCMSDYDDPITGKVVYKECNCVGSTVVSNPNFANYTYEPRRENGTLEEKELQGTATSGKALEGTATSGNCPIDPDCKKWHMLPFLIIFASLLFPMISTTSPSNQATLRTVPLELKSVALGIQLILSRLLGAVPGPPLFGSLLDSACLLWQNQASGGGGACVMYDQETLGWALFLVGLIWKLLSFIFILAAWLFYRSYLLRSGISGLPVLNDFDQNGLEDQSNAKDVQKVNDVKNPDEAVELISSV